jgi:hypothetical protein
MLEIETRIVTERDDPARDFILHSWITSQLWQLGQFDMRVLREPHEKWPPTLTEFLRRITALVESYPPALASIPGESDCYIGWLCAEPTRIYYCYVKYAYKRQGIARRLIQEHCKKSGGVYTYPTRSDGFKAWLINNNWKEEKANEQRHGTQDKASMV